MEYRILGPLEVVLDGDTVAVGSGKQRTLLAALLLNAGEIVSTDRLIGLVWGEDPPRTAAHSIQIYVSELRKVLEAPGQAPLIETRPPGYLLGADPEAVDARRFERLVTEARGRLDADDPAGAVGLVRSAISLWRGSPLSDFAYDEFAQPEIRRLSGLRLDALELLADAELELGHAREALAAAETAIGEDPLREQLREIQMRALYRTGRYAEALRAYQRFATVLAEEAGLDPSPTLRRLQERILVHDPVLAPPEEEPVVLRNPYKGLRPFGEEDADDFFGRDELVRRLIDPLAHGTRLLAVVGPSGCGKSSAVNAGLIPAIREGAVAGSQGWAIARMMPGRHPLEELGVTLASTGVDGARDDGASALETAAREGCAGRDLLLFIDQFEEVFSAAEESQRERLLDVLATVAADRHGRVRLALTLRGDFFDRPLLHQAFAREFVPNVVSVLPMSADEVEAAIVGPAARVGVHVESSLVAVLVADAVDQAGALPFLQLALAELFERRSDGRLGLGDYREIGGLRGVVSGRAEDAYARLSEAGRDLALQVFLRMVRVGVGSRDSRRRVRLSELSALGDDPVELSDVLEAFGRCRLLALDRDPTTGDPTVEVAHEALLWEWERLAGWIERRRSDLRQRAILAAAAEEWRSSGRQPDYLLTGSRLAGHEGWVTQTDLRLAAPEREFLDASVRRRDDEAAEESATLEAHARLEHRARRWDDLWWLGSRPADAALLFAGYGDGGWSDTIAAAFDRGVAEFDLSAERVIATPNSSSGYWAELRRLSEDGVRLIVTADGSINQNAFEAVAADHPETHYPGLDIPPGRLPNVAYLNFDEQEGSYLAGAAAALKSGTGVVGFIGGAEAPVVWRFEAGFEAGARAVRRDVEIRVVYLRGEGFEGFNDPEQALAVATRLYRDGVDVILHAAGGSGWGLFSAAHRMSAELGVHLWAIGADADQYRQVRFAVGEDTAAAYREHILTSMVKRLDMGVYTVVAEHARGEWKGGARRFGLAAGGIGLAYSGGFIDDLRPQLDRLREQIVAGRTEVPTLPSRLGG